MLTIIESESGEEDAVYAANKKTGGDAGPDGYHFEIAFTVDRVLKMAWHILQHRPDATKFTIRKQPYGFVDDLATFDGVVERRFECKAGVQVSWGTGQRSISRNFRREARMFARKGRSGRFRATCCDQIRRKGPNRTGKEVHDLSRSFPIFSVVQS